MIITFHPHTREDVKIRVKWLNNHQAVLYAIDQPNHVTTEDFQNEWITDYEKKLEKGTAKFFTICSDDIKIGFMGLSNINKKIGNANVFILIGEDKYMGKGIGEKSMDYLINFAFTDLGLKTLYLEVDKMNHSAINLYSKLGFQILRGGEKFFVMALSSGVKNSGVEKNIC